jgi:tetratricopeptide (TPR) repeat protein
MKKSIILVFAVSFIFMLSSCNGLKKMVQNAEDINYSVNPEILEMHNGKVAVNITGNFPEKYFNKKVQATITPTIVYEGGEKELTPVYVEGEKIQGNSKVINYKAGGSFSYNETFDYKPEMRRSTLVLKIQATKGSKTVNFEPEVVAQGIVATSDLVKLVGKGSSAKDKFVKDIPDSKVGLVNYDKNQWTLKNTEKKRNEIVELKDYVANVNENDRIEFKGVELTSYASPEGPLDFNSKVSEGRSKTINTYVKNEFKKIDEFKKDDFFKLLTTEEDWEGFKKVVAESNLADKDLILRVVNMNSDPIAREQEIRNMKATFEELEKEVLPKLRRSEIKVNVMLIGHTDEEIKDLFNNNPSELTVEELLYLGLSTENIDERIKIYTKTTELYPKEWRGFNNLGCMQYEKGNYSAAKTALEKAKSIEANSTVFNNLANIYLTENNITEAENNYKTATGISEASIGQGAISIKKGQYKTAVDFFGSDCSYNAALAKLLNKDYDGALKAIDCSNEKEEAMSYYLKAIIGARKSDNNAVFSNLKTATGKDSKLKKLAKNDVEFFKYFEDATFKSIVE